jgi:hypothetical protein
MHTAAAGRRRPRHYVDTCTHDLDFAAKFKSKAQKTHEHVQCSSPIMGKTRQIDVDWKRNANPDLVSSVCRIDRAGIVCPRVRVLACALSACICSVSLLSGGTAESDSKAGTTSSGKQPPILVPCLPPCNPALLFFVAWCLQCCLC